MKNIHRNKSRTRLWDAISGTKEIVGAAGREAVGSITFVDIQAQDETITIGSYVFLFTSAASDSTADGTVADPYLVNIKASLTLTNDELMVVVLATSTIGAWGYLNPDDSDALVNNGTKVTIRFWPGTWANAVTLSGSAGDETIVLPVTASLGRYAPTISLDTLTTDISTVGSTQNEEYYIVQDGEFVGQKIQIVLSAIDASDTPSILGHFFTSTGVQAQLSSAEDVLEILWTGTSWKELTVTDSETAYTASS